jgi:hypothetical protein
MPNQTRMIWHRIVDQHERWDQVQSYTTFLESESIHKVAVYLQDDQHKATVYVKIMGNQLGKNVIDESLNQVLDGEVYLDEDCSRLLEDDFIKIYKSPRRKKDFVYLIERTFAADYIIGVKIVDRIFTK